MHEQDPKVAEVVHERIARLVLEYAQSVPAVRPLPPTLSLRKDLEIESLSLVSLALRLGEEFDVDLVELEIDLSKLETLGDLTLLGHQLWQHKAAPA